MNRTYKRLASVLAALSIITLTGCGQSEPEPAPVSSVANGLGGPGLGGCIPITENIPFTITNGNYIPRKIYAGAIMNGPAEGTVTIGGAFAGGPLHTQAGSEADINMAITAMSGSVGYPTDYTSGAYPLYPTRINGSGVMRISPTMQQTINMLVQTGQIPLYGTYNTMPYNPYQPSVPYNPTMPQTTQTGAVCVSSFGMYMNITTNNELYIGDVYLYFNNTQHGFKLMF